jgi:hypothetical protein
VAPLHVCTRFIAERRRCDSCAVFIMRRQSLNVLDGGPRPSSQFKRLTRDTAQQRSYSIRACVSASWPLTRFSHSSHYHPLLLINNSHGDQIHNVNSNSPQVTDTRPPGLRPNYTDTSAVEKYEMTTTDYESRTDSVLAWKKSQKLGRFDPNAPSIEQQKIADSLREIEERSTSLPSFHQAILPPVLC